MHDEFHVENEFRFRASCILRSFKITANSNFKFSFSLSTQPTMNQNRTPRPTQPNPNRNETTTNPRDRNEMNGICPSPIPPPLHLHHTLRRRACSYFYVIPNFVSARPPLPKMTRPIPSPRHDVRTGIFQSATWLFGGNDRHDHQDSERCLLRPTPLTRLRQQQRDDDAKDGRNS